jgi:deoxyribonuclease V
MKAAVDVHYARDLAVAACIGFHAWEDVQPVAIYKATLSLPAEYRPGRFYLRELAPLMAVLKKTEEIYDTIIIDGFVHLKPAAGKGMGTYLYEALSGSTTIIGVAKNPLKVADRCIPITRGHSKRPLYISAIGCSLELAANFIQRMHGPHRIPTLLRLVDQAARGRQNASICPPLHH